MTYPRELELDEETEQRLISYLDEQLANHYAERSKHIDDLMRWQREYWAEPTNKKATFPFTGASTIIIPLDAIAVEAVHARGMMQAFAMSDIVSAQAVAPDWQNIARPYERHMNWRLMDKMKVRRAFGDCFLEATKFGTMIGKVGYERIVKTAVRTVGDSEEEFDVIVQDGPQFDPVPDARFLMPHTSQDPQLAPWCGEEHEATPYELMQHEISGLFRANTIIDKDGDENNPENHSKLKAWLNRTITPGNAESGGHKFDKQQAKLENTTPVWPTLLNWVEIWLGFDIDGSRRNKEIVVHYHRDSQTIMSCRYNWHSDLRRPYRHNVYFPVEHRWRGIGICKQNEQFQKEITTQHRQSLDNATLANMRMIKVSKLSGYGPKEPIFPGKMWFVDDMAHVDTFQLGEIYPSSYNNQQSTLMFSQMRSGVNEVLLGMPQVGTPGTATSDLARIQEGGKKFDLIFSNFREFQTEIIQDTAVVIQESGPKRLAYYDTVEGGGLVQRFFDMPASAIRDGLIIQLRAVGQQHNKVLDRQNWQQIAALIQQYYNGILQLAQFTQDPTLIRTITMKGLNAATEAMRQLLDSFDVRNIDRIIVSEIEEQVRNGLQGVGAGQPGSDQSPGSIQAPGMDLITQALTSLNGGGNGTTSRLLGR